MEVAIEAKVPAESGSKPQKQPLSLASLRLFAVETSLAVGLAPKVSVLLLLLLVLRALMASSTEIPIERASVISLNPSSVV
jgi:hypothetical protein